MGIIYNNNQLFVYLKIDGSETQVTSANSGFFKKEKISLNITYKIRQKSDYINVIYRITNDDSTSHSIGLATSMWINLGNPNNPISNIDRMKGMKCSWDGKVVNILLRDSYDVTNADTYIYRGVNGIPDGFNERWQNRTSWEEKPQGYNAKLSFSWQNKVLKPQDSIEFVYALGTVEYNKESPLTVTAPSDPYFAPSSIIKANISVDPLDRLSQICIFRYINEIDKTKQTLIANYSDSSNDKLFNDEINLPKVGGYHRIIYILTQNGTEAARESFEVLINEAPRIRSDVELKRQFYVGEEVSFYVDVYDDTFVRLSGMTNTALLYFKDVFCNSEINRTHVKFKIPNDPVGSEHNISIYAYDQYYLISNVYQYNYKVVEFKSPDLEVKSKLKTFYKEKEVINVLGRIRDMDGIGDVYIYSSINSTNITSYGGQQIKDTSWIDVTFRVRVMSTYDTVNTLRLYCIDNKQSISNTFVHTFSVIPENFGYVLCTQTCHQIYTNIIYLSIMVSLDDC